MVSIYIGYIVDCVSILFGTCVWLRLGLIEVAVLGVLIDLGGPCEYHRIKFELSGYGSLIPGLVPASEFKEIRSLHLCVSQAVKRLSLKGLVHVDGRGRHRLLIPVWRSIGTEFIKRTGAGKRILEQD